jgi:Protein of unknown function (DUF4242)
MVYVVERYLPGLHRGDLLSGLSRLTPAIEELHGEGSAVRYLGSTIVPGDEACFCEFEGASEAAVAEANRRAGLPFDRIVPVVLVQSNQRSSAMSVSTPTSGFPRLRAVRTLVVIVAIAAVIALAAWAITSNVLSSGGQPSPQAAPTLASMTPKEQQYVRGISSLSPVQLSAAFGLDPGADARAARVLAPLPRR